MSDLAYVRSKKCGCLQTIAMIDDQNPRDLRDYADLYAAAKRGDPNVVTLTAAEVRTLSWKCPNHKPTKELL